MTRVRVLTRAVVIFVLLVAPVVFMVVGSLRGLDRPPPRGLDFLPDAQPVSEAYRRLPNVIPLGILSCRNSLIVVGGVAVPVTVVVSSWAGFGMSR